MVLVGAGCCWVLVGVSAGGWWCWVLSGWCWVLCGWCWVLLGAAGCFWVLLGAAALLLLCLVGKEEGEGLWMCVVCRGEE